MSAGSREQCNAVQSLATAAVVLRDIQPTIHAYSMEGRKACWIIFIGNDDSSLMMRRIVVNIISNANLITRFMHIFVDKVCGRHFNVTARIKARF